MKRVYNEEEAVDWLKCLHRWWSKEWHEHKGLRVLDNSREASLLPGLDDRTRRRVKVASALPGLGFEKAFAAAQHFDSILEMINAPETEWRRIPGIGKILASAISDAIS